jgi:putative ABC transport system ATP-binding protein
LNNPEETSPDGWAIETQDVWRIYQLGMREVPALRGITLRVPTGHFLVLKGRSGSGKTTLLNCIGGLDQPTRGKIMVFGTDLATLDENHLTRWRSHEVGFVFQSFGLLPTLSAFENVELMQRIAGKSAHERRERARQCLDLVGLTKWLNHRPYEMSGGQQQRVAIARALANRPHLILADEPTGELDSTTAREILSIFRRIVNDEKVTLLVTSHDPLLDDYADDVIRLKDGQIAE